MREGADDAHAHQTRAQVLDELTEPLVLPFMYSLCALMEPNSNDIVDFKTMSLQIGGDTTNSIIVHAEHIDEHYAKHDRSLSISYPDDDRIFWLDLQLNTPSCEG